MVSSITILGGGTGGIIAANLLRKQLPDEHEITVIDREAEQVFAPSLLWLMTGNRTVKEISRPINRIQRKGIKFIQGEIERIKADEHAITVNGENMVSDYLIITLGAALTPDEIPGLKTGYSFYDLKETERLKQKLMEFRKGHVAIVTASPVYKCPAAPYEAALLIHSFFQKRGIRPEVRMSFYGAEPTLMGVAGPNVSKAVQQMLQERDISYYPQHQVTKVDPDQQQVHFTNGVHNSYDLLIYVAPHKPPRVVQNSGLLGENGWVSVDRHTLETKIPGVFAIGDVTGIPLDMGKPLPKAGVFAHGQAKVVANNIAHKITGEGQQMEFAGHGECFIEIGSNKAGFARGNFYATPVPTVKVFQPGIQWHLAKVAFEKSWFRTWF